MTIKVSKLIDRALEHIQVKGPGEITSAEDADICLRSLTSMLDAHQLEAHSTVGLTELVFTPPGSTGVVTIGPLTSDITAEVPVRIDSASYVRVDGLDTKLRLFDNLEQWTATTDKLLEGVPYCAYYSRTPGEGILMLAPLTDGTAELHLWVPQEVVAGQTVLAMADDLTLPNGYRQALEYGLAAEVGPSFEVPPALVGLMERRASHAWRKIKRANFRSLQITPMGECGQDWDIERGY